MAGYFGQFLISKLSLNLQALKERQVMDMKQGESILHTALESALDHKVLSGPLG